MSPKWNRLDCVHCGSLEHTDTSVRSHKHTLAQTLLDPHCCSTHTTSSYPSAIRGTAHTNNNELTGSLHISIYGNLMGSTGCAVLVVASPLGSASTQAVLRAPGT